MKIKDERVLQLNSKIQSEAYLFVLFLSAASVFIKSYIMELPVSQCVAELAIIVLSTLYIVVRSMFLGHSFMDNSKNSKILTVSSVLFFSLAVSIVSGAKNYALYGSKYSGIFDGLFIAAVALTFISSAVFISAVIALLHMLNRAGQKRLERRLNQEDIRD